MSEGPARVIVADCPWAFDDKLPGETRGAEKNYPCLTVEELKVFPLPDIAFDCALFFWRVASQPQAALDVMKAWGFTVKGEVVWLKKTVTGKRWFGMGRILRAEHELCHVAVRGRPPVLNRSMRSTFITEMDFDGLSAVNHRHSQKPDEFYEIVEELFGGPRVEMFARKHRPGWTCLGLEVDGPLPAYTRSPQ